PSLLVELEGSAEHAAIPVVVMTASSPDRQSSGLRYPLLRKPFNIEDPMRVVPECAPRLWDEEEEPTEEMPFFSEKPSSTRTKTEESTAKVRCVACDHVAS